MGAWSPALPYAGEGRKLVVLCSGCDTGDFGAQQADRGGGAERTEPSATRMSVGVKEEDAEEEEAEKAEPPAVVVPVVPT